MQNVCKSADGFFELARGKLILEEIIGSDDVHRYKVEQSLSSPYFDIQFFKIGPPDEFPAAENDGNEDTASQDDDQL